VPVSDEVRAALGDSAELLAQLGHEVVEDRPEVEDELVGTAFMTIVSANVANLVAGREAELGRRAGGNDLEKVSQAMVEAGRRTSGPDYAAAIQALHKASRRIAPFFERYDVLLTPTLAKPPVVIGELATETDDMDAYRERLFGFSPFTSLFNVSGQPACTVPLHWSEAGLPMGTQLVAAYGNEALLFRLAAQLEAARPWFDRRPS
jgi:Asp-tRNA(Asn)/Glu-tRNA(Gln) amidotransferase A subunit family amidase